jgi:hypothetical protein
VVVSASDVKPVFAAAGWNDIVLDWAVAHRGEGTCEASFRRLSLGKEGQRVANFLRRR